MGRDPYQYFRVEAREILDGLGRGVLELDKGGTPETVAGLLRLAHTIKGAARVVRQSTIAEHAHAIEGLLSDLREAIPPDAGERTNQLLTHLDAMASAVAALDAPTSTSAQAPVVPPSGETRGRPSAEEIPRAARGEVSEIDALVDAVSETGLQVRTVRRALGGVARARHLAGLLADQLTPGNGASSLRLRSFADDLRSSLATLDRQLAGAVDQAEREIREVRDAAEKLRLAPAETLFVPLARTVRDVAQALGLQATFQSKGGEVRLDAQVLTAVQAALVQLVRNAVAHGIEPPAERARAGKPPAGRVAIEVVRRGNRITFVCRDDGRGVDLEAVRRVAQRRGLLPAATPPLPAGALLQLLFKGGVTTAGAVTELSGRGIGLDVVRDAAVQLGGEVSVTTEAGRGTTFELTVPLSLSSLEALLVEVDGIAAAIPLDAVRRTVRLTQGEVARTADGETVVYDGQVIPLVPLRRSLRGPAAPAPAWNGGGRSAIVLSGATASAAVAVDRLLGTASLILRPLPPFAPADPVIAGAAVDGEGTPQLVLDPIELVASAFRTDRTLPVATEPTRPPPPILVIDDSLTTRMLEQSILESAGYEVELATSAEEALEKARRRRYRLFLVDVEMPGMDGFSFVTTTRADPVLREVPAILVTSRNGPEDRRRGMDAGASGYVVKGDFDQGQLLALIRGLVR
ncbi:MAG TPA: response regulator [Polyangia bacterium]|nr:response regulator [Polyangia bacterium]